MSKDTTPDPDLNPQQQAAEALLRGGTINDFFKSIDDAAKAEALVKFLREHPDQVTRTPPKKDA